jgi:hypothetical protein
LTKPEFAANKNAEEYRSYPSKQVEKAASIKNTLRKQAKNSTSVEEQKKFTKQLEHTTI